MFERLGRREIYRSPWVNLFVDRVRFPNGLLLEEMHLVDFDAPSVVVIIEDQAGRIALVNVPRYATGEAEWELPAGWVDPADADYLAAARREALEETGYETGNHCLIYEFFPMDGIANKKMGLVYCRATTMKQNPDANEIQSLGWFTQEEIRDLIQRRILTCGISLTGIFLFWELYEKK
jgi:8-oxo-dGTP pyrophosphatase MutT (NUDIX family)